MPKFNVVKTTSINAPIDKVYECVSDLSHWTSWSPWLITEPEATTTVADDLKFYSWEGKRVGSGEMKVTSEETNHFVNYDLTFLKPWKSHAKVRFEVESKGDSTEVTWSMDSSLPFFMFWMKKMMVAFLGMDFQRGLSLLKDYVEEGKVHSKLEFIGEQSYPGCEYIGISREVAMDKIGEAMSEDFNKLWEVIGSNSDIIGGEPISIYHKWELVKGTAKYTAGIPVKSIPANLPQGVAAGKIEPMKIHTLRHIGPYHHLGNAWTAMQMMMRGKEFKPVKGIHPFESYVNNPAEVDEKDLITDVNFAVK